MLTVRHAVKVLLLDPKDRVLLLEATERKGRTPVWCPVGGGIEDGEDLHDAARREVAEETGLHNVHLGAEVWRRRHMYSWRGRETDVHERWLVARTDHFIPSTAGMTAEEQNCVTDFRWWTAEELATTSERVFPPDLGTRLRTSLQAGLPAFPIDIGQ
jgi:8-oxo-dGTP pyrophosphatase MutT (NUDIX family)